MRRHTGTLIPKVKLLLLRPLILAIENRMRQEGVIGAEQIKVMVPMKPCLTSKICAVGLELPVLYKQRLHVADGGGLVAVVIEKARQHWRKCSQHLTKRRRGNVPLKPRRIPPGAESVSDTVSITARREVLKLEVLLAGAGSTPIGSGSGSTW